MNMILGFGFMRYNNNNKKEFRISVLSRPRARMRARSRGFSLMEVVVYVAILGTISVFIVQSLAAISDVYARATNEREALSNARLVLEAVAKAAAQSREVYAPTSRFGIDAGQLSLVSAAATSSGHETGYVDFWVDRGVAMTRSEGQAPAALSASSVGISVFRFEHIQQALGREAVRITVRADSAAGKFPASVTLQTSASLRGNY